jgi:hypothetical protein
MKARIVAATLTVALGFWCGAIAVAQAPQEDILEFAAPGQELDHTLESELPLQGLLTDSPLRESSIAAEVASPTPAAVPRNDWIYTLRQRVSRTPRRQIALASFALGALSVAFWVTVSRVYRRRMRPSYRTAVRTSGGSRQRRLEEVVASVQYADRAMTDNLSRLNEGVASEAGSANPGVGTGPTRVEVPVDR